MAAGLYISYRRDDASAAAGRLADDLARVFGADRIVFDIGSVPAGRDFRQVLREAVGRCSVMLVLLGPRWLDGTDARGRRRLDRPDDVVRLEIAAAFEQGLHVVPVLLGGADCPLSDQLPPDLAPLVRRQAIELTEPRWSDGVHFLVQALRHLPGLALPETEGGAGSQRGVLDGLKRLIGGARRAAAQPAPEPPRRPSAVAPTGSPVPGPPAAPQPLDIFVSYAFEDESWAQQVVAALESQGWRCWLASRDVAPGSASYARDITRAIKASRMLVVVLSAAANGSDDVLNEVTLAKNNRVPRLPFRVDDAPLDDGFEYFFSQAQRLDTAHLEPAEALARLVRAVGRQIGRSAGH